MSGTAEESSPLERKTLFCEVCRVACLNEETFQSHFMGEKHKKVERASHCPKSMKKYNRSFKRFIKFRKRNEPLIGLQYLEHFRRSKHRPDFYRCHLCSLTAVPHLMIHHFMSFKHRVLYLKTAYPDMFPLFIKETSFYERNVIVREQAKEIEINEARKSLKISSRHESQSSIKNDFWKENVLRHRKQEAWYNKMLSTINQKEMVLKYMEKFKIVSQAEATLVQTLSEDLDAVMKVFSMKTKESSKGKLSINSELDKDLGSKDEECTEIPGLESRKRKLPKEEEQLDEAPSTSACDAKDLPLIESSTSAEDSQMRKKARRDSADILSKFTLFSQGRSNSCPGLESEKSKYLWEMKPSDQMPSTSSSRATKVSSDSSNINSAENEKARRASTDLLSTYTLFSQSRSDSSDDSTLFHTLSKPAPKSSLFNSAGKSSSRCFRRPSSSDSSSSLSEGEDHPQEKTRTVKESKKAFAPLSCLVDKDLKTVFTLSSPQKPSPADVTNIPVRHPDVQAKPVQDTGTIISPGQHPSLKTRQVRHPGRKTNPQHPSVQTKPIQHSGVKTEPLQQPDSKMTTVHHSAVKTEPLQQPDSKMTPIQHSDETNPVQDSPSSFLSSALPASTAHNLTSKHLTPVVLQLLKGKDIATVTNILKTLSPFYPELQQVNLAVFARVLSETGVLDRPATQTDEL
ncbi:hypothetical protein FKM82_030685 [Ascaphus truei]